MVWVKLCSKCKIPKSVEQFARDKRQSSGLSPSCKACSSAQRRAFRLANLERLRAASRLHYAQNADAIKQRTAAYYRADPERAKARHSSFYAKHRDERLARQKTYYEVNRDARLQYVKDNAAAFAERTRRREAVKRNATPAWANVAKMREFYEAADFLGMVTGEWHHVDHIVPLQSKLVCGLHCEANLQVIPGVENISKGNRFWPGMP